MNRDNDLSNFDDHVLTSFLATQGIGGIGFYQRYAPLLMGPLLIIITAIFWLLGTLVAGVGVGEILRSETL